MHRADSGNAAGWAGVVYNLMILAAPVLSAVAAYFLCLRVSRDPVSAILGGYVFGFSSYEMAADLATLKSQFYISVALSGDLGIAPVGGRGWAAGDRGPGRAADGRGVFYFHRGICNDRDFFGDLLVACIPDAADPRGLVCACCWAMRSSRALIAGFVLAPFLVEMFRHIHYVNIPKLWPYYFVADPLNFIVPTVLTWIGGAWATPLARHFPGIVQEQGAYIGFPCC